jgi:hypothetical protein
MRSDTLRTIVALMVAFGWMAALLASLYTGQYKGLEVVTPVMMIVTGFLFGYQIQVQRTRQRNGSGGDQ